MAEPKPKVKVAGIALDAWKLPIFEKHLKKAGYTWENKGELTAGTLILRVKTTNLLAVQHLCEKATRECDSLKVRRGEGLH